MGLNETYSAVRGQIMLMHPLPTVKKAYSFLCEEEKQRGLSKPQGNRKPLHCSYCEGTTHTVDRCFFLNGFPVGHKLHGKNVQPPNRSRKTIAYQANTEVISDSHKPLTDPTLQFTPEELAQIKAFFNGKNLPKQANYVFRPLLFFLYCTKDKLESLDH
ncbi:hypothetical protein Patl1_21148 [Pistacia atlantica]|uniref:Uncharacterized protein n=1 Tax=Pistacia atlantica TaxID=434234 RepID=A0ACC1BI03_9ROSI|nr:hypothetical protein Patl1_21148 [Pistacia atlantica]